MKKAIILILVLALALSSFCIAGTIAFATEFENENGVQVTMTPFLYKSAQYQMQFPSHQSYEIKEKSTAGDYAISRELNDLA